MGHFFTVSAISSSHFSCFYFSDVLLGRGGHTSSHPGNVQYRMILDRYSPQYHATSDRLERELMVREIVAVWRNQSPPGRFLSTLRKQSGAAAARRGSNSSSDSNSTRDKSHSTGCTTTAKWYDIGDQAAHIKCHQMLRLRHKKKRPTTSRQAERRLRQRQLQRQAALEAACAGLPSLYSQLPDDDKDKETEKAVETAAPASAAVSSGHKALVHEQLSGNRLVRRPSAGSSTSSRSRRFHCVSVSSKTSSTSSSCHESSSYQKSVCPEGSLNEDTSPFGCYAMAEAHCRNGAGRMDPQEDYIGFPEMMPVTERKEEPVSPELFSQGGGGICDNLLDSISGRDDNTNRSKYARLSKSLPCAADLTQNIFNDDVTGGYGAGN